MADRTAIEWTDHTFNPWIGCTKVGPGCDHCYAERDNARYKWNGGTWGHGAPRKRTSAANWREPLKWNRQAEAFHAEHGHWPRVFTASLADVFDKEVPQFWRNDLFALIGETWNLRWQILTKRVSNVEKMVPREFFDLNPHVGLMITVVNQAEAERDVPRLLDLKARLGIRWVGLSCEPLLGPIDLTDVPAGKLAREECGAENCCGGQLHQNALDNRTVWCDAPMVDSEAVNAASLDWVIAGGARPMHPDWVRSLLNQCLAAGTAFFFKHWGEWAPPDAVAHDKHARAAFQDTVFRVGRKAAGALLDGREWRQFPEALAIGDAHG